MAVRLQHVKKATGSYEFELAWARKGEKDRLNVRHYEVSGYETRHQKFEDVKMEKFSHKSSMPWTAADVLPAQMLRPGSRTGESE